MILIMVVLRGFRQYRRFLVFCLDKIMTIGTATSHKTSVAKIGEAFFSPFIHHTIASASLSSNWLLGAAVSLPCSCTSILISGR